MKTILNALSITLVTIAGLFFAGGVVVLSGRAGG